MYVSDSAQREVDERLIESAKDRIEYNILMTTTTIFDQINRQIGLYLIRLSRSPSDVGRSVRISYRQAPTKCS